MRRRTTITFVEYTLTFLVSMAAMVTFVADRFPMLDNQILGVQYRGLVAIGLSLFTGWLVNRGPKMAARDLRPGHRRCADPALVDDPVDPDPYRLSPACAVAGGLCASQSAV